ARGTTTAAIPASSSRKVVTVRTPMRPSARTSATDAMPVTISETIKGMTVILMALTQSVPIGAMASAARKAMGLPVAPIAAPAAIATTRATRTLDPSFMQTASIGVSGPVLFDVRSLSDQLQRPQIAFVVGDREVEPTSVGRELAPERSARRVVERDQQPRLA